MRKVAVTGGIASGKTTVCHILAKHGAYTLNSDLIIHQILKEDPIIKRACIALLGPSILKEGEIDRTAVAEIIFKDKKKLEAWQQLLHPKLLEIIKKTYLRLNQDKKCSLFVVELPLVQEIGKENLFDLIIAVSANEEIAQKRFIEKGFSIKTYNNRKKEQWKSKKKARFANRVIENNGSKEELEKHVVEIMEELDSQ